MKNIHITTSQRAIAYLLLVSQLLTSCGWNEMILPRKKQERTTQQEQYMAKMKELDLNKEEDRTQVTLPASILTDDSHGSTGDQPIQNRQELALISDNTDQLFQSSKDTPKQLKPKEKKEHPFSHANLKPVKQNHRTSSKQGMILNTPQPTTKSNQKNIFNPIVVHFQEVSDSTFGKPAIETPVSYGPYNTIKGGYQVQFIQREGQWVAQVRKSLPIGISRQAMNLPVFLEFGLSMEEVSKYPHMDIVFPTKSNDGEGYVVCKRQPGLPGGMMKKKTGEEDGYCIYKDNEKRWDEGLGRWVCPGPEKHPRSGPQPSESEAKTAGQIIKEIAQKLHQLKQHGGTQVQLSKEAMEEWKREEEEKHRQQRERDRIERRVWEAEKERERQYGEELRRVYSEIHSIKNEVYTKYHMDSNKLINLPDRKTIEAFQQDVTKAIYAIGEKQKELGRIMDKYEGQDRFIYHGEPKEELQPDGPFELWQLDTPTSMELYELYVKAEEGKQWFIFYEETIAALQQQMDEIDKLRKKVSPDKAGLQALNQLIDKAKELQNHIEDAIQDIKCYGVNNFSFTEAFPVFPMYDLHHTPPKKTIKKIGKYQPSREYKERRINGLKNAQAELETIIKNYTRRRDIVDPHMKRVGEFLVNQGIKVIQEQGSKLFSYPVENYLVELRPKKGQNEISEKNDEGNFSR
jgi:hypothetical protein